MSQQVGLRMVATLEASKGILAVIVALGIHTLFSHDAYQVALNLVKYCHLNPINYYPHMFIDKVGSLTPDNIGMITVLVLAYSSIRFIEAYGLWKAKTWTEWFAFLSGTIYLPFEIYEMIKQIDVLTVGAFVINIIIVAYMGYILFQPKMKNSASIKIE